MAVKLATLNWCPQQTLAACLLSYKTPIDRGLQSACLAQDHLYPIIPGGGPAELHHREPAWFLSHLMLQSPAHQTLIRQV